jgi:AcrR family transcriptional regulator
MEITPRQQDVVNAAIKIIAEKGYQELTTKHIAEVVGVSEAALYRHFENKLDIIHKILDYFSEVTTAISEKIKAEAKSPIEQIKAFVLNRYSLFIEKPDLAKVMFSEEIFHNDRSLAEHNLSIMHSHRNQLVEAIEKAQKEQTLRDDIEAIQLFRIIIGSMRLLVTQWQLCGFAFSLKDEGEELWNSIYKMIIKES